MPTNTGFFLVRYTFNSVFGSGNPPTQNEIDEFNAFYRNQQGCSLISISAPSMNGNVASFIVQQDCDPELLGYQDPNTNSDWIAIDFEITAEAPVTVTYFSADLVVKFNDNPLEPNTATKSIAETYDVTKVVNGLKELFSKQMNLKAPRIEKGLVVYAQHQVSDDLIGFEVVGIGYFINANRVIVTVEHKPELNVNVAFSATVLP